MIGRTVTFISPVVLSLKNNQIVVVFKDRPEEKHTIPVEDLGLVMINLPTQTKTERKEAARFRKELEKDDFVITNFPFINGRVLLWNRLSCIRSG